MLIARPDSQFDRVDAAKVADLEIRQDELADAWAALSSSAQQACKLQRIAYADFTSVSEKTHGPMLTNWVAS